MFNKEIQYSFENKIVKLKELILSKGIPDTEADDSEDEKNNHKISLRVTIWKLLLGVYHIDAQNYVKLIEV